MVGANSGPATAVSASPIVECLCKKLESFFHSPQKRDRKTISRWRLVLGAYHHIRELVTLNDKIMKNTNLQLYELNQATLLKWYIQFPLFVKSLFHCPGEGNYIDMCILILSCMVLLYNNFLFFTLSSARQSYLSGKKPRKVME